MAIQNIIELKIIDSVSSMSTFRYATTQNDDRIILDGDKYPASAKGILIYNGSNDQDTGAGSIQMQYEDGTNVTGATVTLDLLVWPTFQVKKSSPFTIPSGVNAFKFTLSSADDVLSKAEVLVVIP